MATGKIKYDITANVSKFTSAMNETNRKLNGFSNNVKKMGGLLAGAFAVGKIAAFTKEVFSLSETTVEVERAFKNLNNPTLLKNLRSATQGAVSDLTLMKKAVSADNLGIPIKDLGILFEFASKRAAQTGENVDHLVDSIVTGIGRKSALVLDNLGIVMSTAGKSTSDVAEEVRKLAEVELVKMGDVGANASDKLSSSFDNFKVSVGNFILREGNEFLEWASKAFDKLTDLMGGPSVSQISTNIDQLRHAMEQDPSLKTSQNIQTLRRLDAQRDSMGPSLHRSGLNFSNSLSGMQMGGLREIQALPQALLSMSEIQSLSGEWLENQQRISAFTKEIDSAIRDMAGPMEEWVDVSAEIDRNTMQWTNGLFAAQGIVGAINTALGVTEGKMKGLSKFLRFITTGLNITSQIAGVANLLSPGTLVSKILGGGGGRKSLNVAGRIGGRDIWLSGQRTNSAYSAIGGPARND